jgi:hypothetical protein
MPCGAIRAVRPACGRLHRTPGKVPEIEALETLSAQIVSPPSCEEKVMHLILLIILIVLLVGALPSWGYSRGWGYYPSGGLGLILIIILILYLMGYVA